ncbi:MAG: ABC transporter permease [Snowella sp.]|nr:ABC transporter permease [Snowella sp.]
MRQFWQEILAVAQRILIELVRRKRSLMFWVIFPVVVLLLNGFIFADRSGLPLSQAMEFAAPSSLVGAALFFSCLGGSLATVVSERENQTLKRLFISPLRGISYFLGIFLAHALIGIGQGLIIYTVATYFKAEFRGSIFLGILVIILSIISYVGVGFIFGTQLARRTEDVNALVATFGVPLLILGGAFFPASIFPKPLLAIAQYNPIYHMNQTLTGIWADGSNFVELKSHFIFLISFAFTMIIMGWFSYQKMLQRERRL